MKKSQIIMAIGALLLGALYLLPLWNITLIAPQYPEPLGLNIHITHLSDGVQFNDVKNIDLLNHYIGMAHLPTEENVAKHEVEPFVEFTIFPIVIGVMIVLGLLVAFKGNYKWFLYWLIIMVILGTAGLYDFYSWLGTYGHDLDPNAILKIIDPKTGELMGYQPPFFGFKKILNFEVYSYPSAGAYFIAVGMLLSFVAYLIGKKEIENS
jgi:hypothetical protein